MTDPDPKSGIDPLLAALADAAREEDQQADAWWDAVQAGDRAGLPEDGPALEALAPLDDQEQARLTAALFGAPAEQPAPLAPVINLAARRRWLSAAASLAVAAGVAAMVLLSSGPTLPGYALEVRAGEQALRSEGPAAAEPVYAPGSVLSFVLRPERRAEQPVTVAAVLYPERGAAAVVEFEVEASPEGAVRLSAELGRTFSAAPGRYRLVFWVAPEGGLPVDPAEAAPAELEGAQRLEHRFRIVADD